MIHTPYFTCLTLWQTSVVLLHWTATLNLNSLQLNWSDAFDIDEVWDDGLCVYFKSDSGGPSGWRFIDESNLPVIVVVKLMASTGIIKRDFLWKRAQMKSRITKENYKQRWFELTSDFLRYSDGSREVNSLTNSLIKQLII